MENEQTINSRQLVQKVWGGEDWVVNTPQYCGKILHVNEGWMGSLHMHPIKDETMLIIDGCGVIEYYPNGLYGKVEFMLMKPEEGSSLRIPPGTYHRLLANLGQDMTLVEFSTHHEDSDVQRVQESGEIR